MTSRRVAYSLMSRTRTASSVTRSLSVTISSHLLMRNSFCRVKPGIAALSSCVSIFATETFSSAMCSMSNHEACLSYRMKRAIDATNLNSETYRRLSPRRGEPRARLLLAPRNRPFYLHPRWFDAPEKIKRWSTLQLSIPVEALSRKTRPPCPGRNSTPEQSGIPLA